MKPVRIRMTASLCLAYGLFDHMRYVRPPMATATETTTFHSDDYISFISTVLPANVHRYAPRLVSQYGLTLNDDCPVFDGLWPFSQMSAGGSIAGAARLNERLCDVAINWSGGLHHAKRSAASGFCYVNDAVLAILELLKVHERVLYVDLDVHHGDGVEEAFYESPRVLCLSSHMFGNFFPGTGDVTDTGAGDGVGYSVNIPLKEGASGRTLTGMFFNVLETIMEQFNPSAVVCQCGADSIAGDRLGPWNVPIASHVRCVEAVISYGKPTLVLGGGGYTVRNVARCWTAQSAMLVQAEVSPSIPLHDYFEYYGPDYQLAVPVAAATDFNTPARLAHLRETITTNLRRYVRAPTSNIFSSITTWSGIHEREREMLDDECDMRPDERLGQTAREMHRMTSVDCFVEPFSFHPNSPIHTRSSERMEMGTELSKRKEDILGAGIDPMPMPADDGGIGCGCFA